MTKTDMTQKVEVSAIVIRADGTREDLGVLNTTKRRKRNGRHGESNQHRARHNNRTAGIIRK